MQLDPPLPLMTPKGAGLAHFLIDYGAELHLMWTVFIDATGECWTFPNPQIRIQNNVTLGRDVAHRRAPGEAGGEPPAAVALHGDKAKAKGF